MFIMEIGSKGLVKPVRLGVMHAADELMHGVLHGPQAIQFCCGKAVAAGRHISHDLASPMHGARGPRVAMPNERADSRLAQGKDDEANWSWRQPHNHNGQGAADGGIGRRPTDIEVDAAVEEDVSDAEAEPERAGAPGPGQDGAGVELRTV